MRICKTVMGRHFVVWWGRGDGGTVKDAAAVCVYACVFSNRFFGSPQRWRLVQEQVPPEPKPSWATWRWNTNPSSHKSYMEGILSSSVAFIPFQGQCKKRLSLFFFFPFNMHRYCKSTRHRSGKYQRQIKKKGTGKFFSLPPPLHPYPSLFYLSVAESQWFIIIGRCHHADDTQSPRSEYH